MQRHITYRWFVLLVLGSLLAVLCSGCASFIPTPDPVTISFVYPEYGDIGQYELMAQQFQEMHSYITIELHSDENVTASTLPTYDSFIAEHFALPTYISDQAVLNLDAFIEQDEDMDTADFYPGVLGALQSQGRTWGLPLGVNMLMLFYNRDVFDSFGVSYPQLGWDWGDFLDAAFSVNDPFDDRYAYAMHYNDEFAVYEPVIMIYQHGGGVFDDLENPTRVMLDTPENIEAMNFYQALIHDHHVAPMPDEITRLGRPYPWRAVYENRVAMWSMMYADRGGVTWPQEWDFNWGVLPLPGDEINVTMATVSGVYISSECAHPEEAYMWIEFVSQQSPPLLMPSRQSQAQSNVFENEVGYEVAESARAAMQGAVVINPNVMNLGEGLEVMWGAFEAIRKGETTAEIVLSTAQDGID